MRRFLILFLVISFIAPIAEAKMVLSESDIEYCAEPVGESLELITKILDPAVTAVEIMQKIESSPQLIDVKTRNCEPIVFVAVKSKKVDLLKSLITKFESKFKEAHPVVRTYRYCNEQDLADKNADENFIEKNRSYFDYYFSTTPEKDLVCIGNGRKAGLDEYAWRYGNLEILKLLDEKGLIAPLDWIRGESEYYDRHFYEYYFYVFNGDWKKQELIELNKFFSPFFEKRINVVFSRAVSNASLEVVKFLIEFYKLDVNAVDEDGDSMLQIASKANAYPIVSFLIKSGAKINYEETGHRGYNALDYAIIYGSPQTVQILVASGMDINQFNRSGYQSTLDAAAEFGTYRTLSVLFKNGATDDLKSVLKNALKDKANGCLSLKCSRTAIIILDYLSRAPVIDQKLLNYAFLLAARFGESDLVSRFIKKGADVNSIVSDYFSEDEFASHSYEIKLPVGYIHAYQFTAAGLAILNNDIETLKRLSDNHALLDSPSLKPNHISTSDFPKAALELVLMDVDQYNFGVDWDFNRMISPKWIERREKSEKIIQFLVSKNVEKRFQIHLDKWYLGAMSWAGYKKGFVSPSLAAKYLNYPQGIVKTLR